MVAPERRTRGDIIAALAIVAVIAVVAAAIWWTSDARATISRPAAEPSKSVPSVSEVPATLSQLWTADSPATTVPVVASGTVITGVGGTVEGREPVTGAVRWSYARDRELCGVSWVYHYTVAVYPDGRGCGQVSTIDSSTGKRGPTRSGDADNPIDLSSDGGIVLAAGSTRLETWRSDMVRVIGYGEVDARVKPNHTAVGKGCMLMSAAASSAAVSVFQACPGEQNLRLTLLRAGDQDDEPLLRDVGELEVDVRSEARVLAVVDTTTAVYLPTPTPRVAVFDDTGTETASIELAAPATSTRVQGTVSRTGDVISWWTGDAVLVFAADDLTHRFTIASSATVHPLGPATEMADRLLVPVTGGMGVFNAGTGAVERMIPVKRDAVNPVGAPIVPHAVGPTVVEQRGSQIFALG